MSFSFSVLASGSRANCTFVEAAGQRFLVDCGLSAKQIELRLKILEIDPTTISAILISHEHGDHIRGASVFSRRYKIPVYANAATAKYLNNVYAVERFTTGENFGMGLVDFYPFRITHDAVDPVGFVIEAEQLKLTHATDIGKACPILAEALKGANAVVLEANHDHELLMTCDYHWELKQRIASSHGHLENAQAGRCLNDSFSSELNHIVLAHLSENSNTPVRAKEVVLEQLRDRNFGNITCADPYAPTALFNLAEPNHQFFKLAS